MDKDNAIKDAAHEQNVLDAALKAKLEAAPVLEPAAIPGVQVDNYVPAPHEHGFSREEEAESGNVARLAPIEVPPEPEPAPGLVTGASVGPIKPKAKAGPKAKGAKPVGKLAPKPAPAPVPEPVVKPVEPVKVVESKPFMRPIGTKK